MSNLWKKAVIANTVELRGNITLEVYLTFQYLYDYKLRLMSQNSPTHVENCVTNEQMNKWKCVKVTNQGSNNNLLNRTITIEPYVSLSYFCVTMP